MSAELSLERPTTLALNADTRVERRVHFNNVVDHSRTPKHSSFVPNNTISPRKYKPVPEFRPKRKRSHSFSMGDHKYGNKRRRKSFVLPSKFLLGGTFSDPLNLGSLRDNDQKKSNRKEEATTTKSTNPVKVIIPNNIKDPLNLEAASPIHQDLETALLSNRRRRRNRKRRRRLSAPGGVEREDALNVSSSSLPELHQSVPLEPIKQFSANVMERMKPLTVNTDLPVNTGQSSLSNTPKENTMGDQVVPTGVNKASSSGQQKAPGLFKRQRSKIENKIVSPVIPQPGGNRKRHLSKQSHLSDQPHLSQQTLQPPEKYNPKAEMFQYGNYNKYYGYRNPDQAPDARLNYLSASWFEGKEVLDIGCNIGHITLTVARDYNPKRCVGIDIDKKLINIAQKNIKHYMRQGGVDEVNFPKSMRALYGPLKPPVMTDGSRSFPYNTKFVHANYVLESDELLETVRPEFDIILCLSISKWVHLNFGDDGLKRFFRRAYANLKPGGKFILEPQAWSSYSKRRKLTPRIFENYKKIRLFPEKFKDFLLHDIGFMKSEKLPTPQHTARGFQRPIIVYTKRSNESKSSSSSDINITNSQSEMISNSSKRNEQCKPENVSSNNDLLKVDPSYRIHEMPDNSELEVNVRCEDFESVSKGDTSSNCNKKQESQDCDSANKSSCSNEVLELDECSTMSHRNLPEQSVIVQKKGLVLEKGTCDMSVSSSSSISSSSNRSCNTIPLNDTILESNKQTCPADTITSSDGHPVICSKKDVEKSISNDPTKPSASSETDSDKSQLSTEQRTTISENVTPPEKGENCDLNSSSAIRKRDSDSDECLSPKKKMQRPNNP